MGYTEDDWQAQLEELLALQSIYADDFRSGLFGAEFMANDEAVVSCCSVLVSVLGRAQRSAAAWQIISAH
jgi:hypothetical protein